MHTPESIAAVLSAQRAAFAAQPRRPLSDRREDLLKIERLVSERQDEWIDAVSADFGHRSATETRLLELSPILRATHDARKNLGRWTRPEKIATPLIVQPGRSFIRREPKGVVGVVSPWNYPLQLALVPLATALAAGCRVMIKPSELTPRTNALMAARLAELFPQNQVAVIEGGPQTAQAFCAQPFDHLFYTGSGRVGRSVAAAAAANLTPVTLELGGKSPVVVDPAYPLADVVHPLTWGRFLNAGQTCIAPDYVLATGGADHAARIAEFVLAQITAFYPDFVANPDYSAIVAPSHYDRLEAMVEEARVAGAQVLQPAHDPATARASRKFPPTLVIDPPADSRLMKEEIFGPILPVVGAQGLDDALSRINAGDRPLALYVFSNNRAWTARVLDHTHSGGVTLNGTLLHLANENLPFGGVGASGYGAYHGRRGFEEFTHARAVFSAGRWHSTRLAAPPYGRLSDWISRMSARF